MCVCQEWLLWYIVIDENSQPDKVSNYLLILSPPRCPRLVVWLVSVSLHLPMSRSNRSWWFKLLLFLHYLSTWPCCTAGKRQVAATEDENIDRLDERNT